ncbi:mucin-7-like [Schistocerca cancellata]|uniref:mucin-7-like n=1 Tax=Schistocerca cancellata TaxID=274614 RepID=UPI0021195154|nr:mucin-7-like [Schistocerca cancellata]
MSLPLAPTVLKQASAEVFPQKMLKASETITAATTTKAATAATSTAEPPLVPAAATESMIAGPTPPKVVKTSRTVTLTTTTAVTAPSTTEPALIPAGKSTAKATEPSLATAEPSTIAAEPTPTLAEPYLPKKPIKRGYKVWVLADKSGCARKLDIYTGKKDNAVEKKLGERVVKDLTENIKDKYNRVYFDNYFSSPDLLQDLKEKIHAYAPS